MDFKTLVSACLIIAGLLYQYKYFVQGRKILRLQTSKGVAKTYFAISILYEAFCIGCGFYLQNWVFFWLSVFPFIGNLIVWLIAIKYMPQSHKNTAKSKMYAYIKRMLK